jgi:predicted dehydrogenase
MAHLVASTSSGRPREASEISGSARLGPSGVDLSAAGTVCFEDGPLARVACSIEANLDNSVRIVGSEGRITVPSPWLPGRMGTDARIVLERWGMVPDVIEIPIEADVYTLEVDAVNAFVRKDELDPSILTWEESLANMRTLDRWREAIGLRYPGLDA